MLGLGTLGLITGGTSLFGGLMGNLAGREQQKFGMGMYRYGQGLMGQSTDALSRGLSVLDNYNSREDAMANLRLTGGIQTQGDFNRAFATRGGSNQNNTYLSNLFSDIQNRNVGVKVDAMMKQGTLAQAQGYRDIGNSFGMNAQPYITGGGQMVQSGIGSRNAATQDALRGFGTSLMYSNENFLNAIRPQTNFMMG